jgi:hypothetical protein
MLVKLCLDKNLYDNRQPLGDSFLYKDMTDNMEVFINKWQFDNLGSELSREHIVFINRYLEAQFEEELYKYCSWYTSVKVDANKRNQGYKDAIHSFAEQFNIDLLGDINHDGTQKQPDISFDGLKRKELRYRGRLEKSKVEVKILSTLFS